MWAVEHQTVPLYRILLNPWEDVRFQRPFVLLLFPVNLVILDPATLQEANDVDVMQAMKQSALQLGRACNGSGEDGGGNAGVGKRHS